MDIFSSVKDVTHKIQSPVDNNIKKNEPIKEVEHLEKNRVEKKSKEEIRKELQKVIEELNEAMNPLNIDLKFKFNDKIDELTVLVIDKKDNRVIREFPPKEALKLMEKMRELVGMLFDEKG